MWCVNLQRQLGEVHRKAIALCSRVESVPSQSSVSTPDPSLTTSTTEQQPEEYTVHVAHGSSITHVEVNNLTTVSELHQQWCKSTAYIQTSTFLVFQDKVITTPTNCTDLLVNIGVVRDCVVYGYTAFVSGQHPRGTFRKLTTKRFKKSESLPPKKSESEVITTTRIGRVVTSPIRLWW